MNRPILKSLEDSTRELVPENYMLRSYVFYIRRIVRGWRDQHYSWCVLIWCNILLGTHHIYREFVVSLLEIYTVVIMRHKILSSPQVVPPEGNTSLRLFCSHNCHTRLQTRTTVKISPIGSLA